MSNLKSEKTFSCKSFTGAEFETNLDCEHYLMVTIASHFTQILCK